LRPRVYSYAVGIRTPRCRLFCGWCRDSSNSCRRQRSRVRAHSRSLCTRLAVPRLLPPGSALRHTPRLRVLVPPRILAWIFACTAFVRAFARCSSPRLYNRARFRFSLMPTGFAPFLSSPCCRGRYGSPPITWRFPARRTYLCRATRLNTRVPLLPRPLPHNSRYAICSTLLRSLPSFSPYHQHTLPVYVPLRAFSFFAAISRRASQQILPRAADAAT